MLKFVPTERLSNTYTDAVKYGVSYCVVLNVVKYSRRTKKGTDKSTLECKYVLCEFIWSLHVCRCRSSRLVESWEGLQLLMLTDVSTTLAVASTPTVLLRTLLTWTIFIYKHVTILQGSNHLLYMIIVIEQKEHT